MTQREQKWKGIENFTRYEVSDDGVVKSLNFHSTGKDGYLKYDHNKGYRRVTLCVGFKTTRFQVHRLVYLTFNNMPLSSPGFVCHKNDIRDDNRLENLFYGTAQDNVTDMVSKKRHCFGARQVSAKLDADKVRSIRKIFAEGKTSKAALARKFEVGQSTIGRVLSGTHWKHVE